MKKLLLTLFLLAFVATADLYGQASATATFTASATIIEPVGITTTSNLNFANIDARNGGEVILRPDNTRNSTGDLILEDGNVTAASFEITGQQGFSYSVSLPQGEFELSNGAESMIIKDFTSDMEGGFFGEGPGVIRVGASLQVKPNQIPGIYHTTTPLQLSVNYN
ncbi:DUF4402 domain-containing protein [Salegentibacter sp. HM20]